MLDQSLSWVKLVSVVIANVLKTTWLHSVSLSVVSFSQVLLSVALVIWGCYLENPRKKQLSLKGSALLSTKGLSSQNPLCPSWIIYLCCKTLRSHFGYQVHCCSIAKVWSSNPRVVAVLMSQYSCPSPLSDHYRGPVLCHIIPRRMSAL